MRYMDTDSSAGQAMVRLGHLITEELVSHP